MNPLADRNGEYEAVLERIEPPRPSERSEKRAWSWASTEEDALAQIVESNPGWRVLSIKRSLF